MTNDVVTEDQILAWGAALEGIEKTEAFRALLEMLTVESNGAARRALRDESKGAKRKWAGYVEALDFMRTCIPNVIQKARDISENKDEVQQDLGLRAGAGSLAGE
jgi:hypothetical protein